MSDPEKTLRRICDFIDLDFGPQQLSACERAGESGRPPDPENGEILSAKERQEIHKLTLRPPDPTRIGRYAENLSEVEISEFESIAGDMLMDLGYKLRGS